MKIRRIAAAFAAIAIAAATPAAALPLSNGGRVTIDASVSAKLIRYRRCTSGCTVGCPVRYERTFWGAYRLYSPCSNRVVTHSY